jgi:hypothetical protein
MRACELCQNYVAGEEGMPHEAVVRVSVTELDGTVIESAEVCASCAPSVVSDSLAIVRARREER